MKIYKLDIDTSKPIRKVVQMQQNSTGALSVDVSNDGKYIRNLSCALYDGDTELSAYATTDVGAGYKIDMGDTTKVVKFTAKSVPTECSASYVVKLGNPPAHVVAMTKFMLDTGVYNQDEFNNVAKVFGDTTGITVFLYVNGNDLSNANFQNVALRPWNSNRPVYFLDNNGIVIPEDEPIIATGQVRVCKNDYVGRTGSQISSFTYPAIGYYTDYSLDTVIRPSDNAHCYAEQEVADPTPDPEPEPTPDPEEPVEP